ncbi:MAG: winged helix-turn-helix domain-containing protein [Pseudomonadota bacterium]
MNSLLVISDQPALGETLANELAEDFSFSQASIKAAGNYLNEQKFDLIIVDDPEKSLPESADSRIIKLLRPIRLHDALYTIRKHLQIKSNKEQILIADKYVFLAIERLLKSQDGKDIISLTEKESELLKYFTENPGNPLSRENILKQIWGYNPGIETHTLETHIYRLRSKLKDLDGQIDIVFCDGEGYKLSY